MAIPRFRLERPASIDEATAAFAAAHGDAAYFAGGTELLQVMKLGFAQYGTLIDLKRVPELGGIVTGPDGTLRIGATTTHRAIEHSSDVVRAFPALASLARRIANVRVRSTGTIGGNLAFAEPHSDPSTLLMASGATLDLVGAGGPRAVEMAAFTLGPFVTDRADDEVIAAVRIPPRRPREGRGHGRIAYFERPTVSVAVRLEVGDDAVTSCDVAVGSVTEAPTIVAEAGRSLEGAPLQGAGLADAIKAAGGTFEALDIAPGPEGSPAYRRHLAVVAMARAIHEALNEALAHD